MEGKRLKGPSLPPLLPCRVRFQKGSGGGGRKEERESFAENWRDSPKPMLRTFPTRMRSQISQKEAEAEHGEKFSRRGRQTCRGDQILPFLFLCVCFSRILTLSPFDPQQLPPSFSIPSMRSCAGREKDDHEDRPAAQLGPPSLFQK